MGKGLEPVNKVNHSNHDIADREGEVNHNDHHTADREQETKYNTVTMTQLTERKK